jgi:hypothetical protein
VVGAAGLLQRRVHDLLELRGGLLHEVVDLVHRPRQHVEPRVRTHHEDRHQMRLAVARGVAGARVLDSYVPEREVRLGRCGRRQDLQIREHDAELAPIDQRAGFLERRDRDAVEAARIQVLRDRGPVGGRVLDEQHAVAHVVRTPAARGG